MSPRIRVLVVDDSAFARKVLRQILSSSPAIEVVDVAWDGLDALEKIAQHKPDVITLDLMMPNLDGLGVLQALPKSGGPRVVVVSISDVDSDLGVKALQSGAVDIVQKPTALATDRLFELSDTLLRKVTIAAAARPRPVIQRAAPEAAPTSWNAAPGRARVLVIGASTGGPQALTHLLTALPGDVPIPIVIALHIPYGYTESLARRLDEASALSVVEASDNLELRPGVAVIARGGTHLEVERRSEGSYARFVRSSSQAFYCPSIDLLFKSAANQFGSSVMAVVLTGMGDDGLEGARAIHSAGGLILTEAESSCVVYGMPRCVRDAGLAAAEAAIDAMPAAIVRRLIP